jgi:hypothetical protein
VLLDVKETVIVGHQSLPTSTQPSVHARFCTLPPAFPLDKKLHCDIMLSAGLCRRFGIDSENNQSFSQESSNDTVEPYFGGCRLQLDPTEESDLTT